MSEAFGFEGTAVRVGPGCMAEAAGLCQAFPGRVLVVVGQEAMRRQGHLDRLLAALPAGTQVVAGIPVNPGFEAVQELADRLVADGVAVLVALGGGSVLDAAKAARVVAGSGLGVRELLARAEPRRAGVPGLVLIPTTCGTGSEVTPFATVWDLEAGRKFSLDGPALRATGALVDPELTRQLPEDLLRQTAGDALTHACEALWARRATPLSDAHAGEAIRRLRHGLDRIRAAPGDPEGRGQLAWGSLLAGMAISTTRTAAAHALSYRLTMQHRVPHGVAVASLLPHVLRETWPGLETGRRIRLAAAFEVVADEALPDTVAAFLEGHGLVRPLGDILADPGERHALVAAADVPGRLDNHCVPLDGAALARVLEAAR